MQEHAPQTAADRSGLTSAVAARRLREEGYNELPTTSSRSIPKLIVEVVSEPMILMLLAGAVLYFVLGSIDDALILLVSVAGVAAITVYQQRKTERVLEALRDLSSPRALVLRDGAERRIAGREVVREDLLLLREGDRVPADAVALEVDDLLVDEALLTGESVPVAKGAAGAELPPARPGGDGLPYVFAGTLIVKGNGLARVSAIGAHTEMGRIGVSLKTIVEETAPLQRQTTLLVRNLAVIGLAVCLIVAAVYGATRGDWLGGFLAGLTLAMAILPEEFPVVVTVFLALGAWRISREHVLTRRAPAIETLGSATVLCVDKTGTLTQNRMAVHTLWTEQVQLTVSGESAADEALIELLRAAVFASEPQPFDPMERALTELSRRWQLDIPAQAELVRHYPISAELLVLAHGWRLGAEHRLDAKGAPEAVVSMCGLTPGKAEAVLEQASAMARSGLRVLAVATLPVAGRDFPDVIQGQNLHFVGLVGFADPLRPSAPATVRECRRAGIRVLMITGDYPETAKAIARQVGLEHPDECLTGDEVQSLSDSVLRERLSHVNVCARIAPTQKLRIVEALKASGEIVAMTGDGVNDAPALRAAHIGVAMGGRGTDVAREAASLVLLNDDFVSITHAVRLGRRIFTNLRKAMSYILSVHIPTIGMTVVPVAAGWPLVFFPVHIVFLELIIDPACSIAFEAEPAEADVMDRPPRDPAEPLFGGPVLLASLLQGLIALVFVFLLYLIAHAQGRAEDELRSLAFTAVVAANLALIFFNRGADRGFAARFTIGNPALWWVMAGTAVAYSAVLLIPALRAQFRMAPLTAADYGMLALGLVALAVVLELARRFGPCPARPRPGTGR